MSKSLGVTQRITQRGAHNVFEIDRSFDKSVDRSSNTELVFDLNTIRKSIPYAHRRSDAATSNTGTN